MYKTAARVFAGILALGLSNLNLHAAEKTISREQMPPAVLAVADRVSQGAKVLGYSRNTEQGKLEFEVQMKVGGHTKDVTIAPDGRVLEIEEEVALDSLPSNVIAGLKARAGEGRIVKVESLNKQGIIVAYEAQIVKAGKHSEVQVDPTGKRPAHEE